MPEKDNSLVVLTFSNNQLILWVWELLRVFLPGDNTLARRNTKPDDAETFDYLFELLDMYLKQNLALEPNP